MILNELSAVLCAYALSLIQSVEGRRTHQCEIFKSVFEFSSPFRLILSVIKWNGPGELCTPYHHRSVYVTGNRPKMD